MRQKLAILCAYLVLCLTPVHAKDPAGLKNLEKSLRRASGTLTPNLSGKVCIGDFSDAADGAYTSEFGQKLPEILSILLVNRKKRAYTMMERRELFKITQDSHMMRGDDAEVIENLQKHSKVDMYMSGTYGLAGPQISISIKVIAVKTGELISAATVNIDRTGAFDKMIAHRFRQYPESETETKDPPSGTNETIAPPAAAGDLTEMEVGVFYEGGDGRLYPVREGMVLTSKDSYALYVRALQPSHVYIYQVDSSQTAFRIFPNATFSEAVNPMAPGEHWIPKGRNLLYLDENPGQEDLYVFATRAPNPGLANIKQLTPADIKKVIRTMGVAGMRASSLLSKVKDTQGNTLELTTRKLAAQGDFVYRLSFVHH